MKYLVVVVVAFLTLVLAQEEWKPVDEEGLRKIHAECAKEAGLTEEQISAIRSAERPDVKEVHDYVLCNVKKIRIFDDDMGYDAARLHAQHIAMGVSEEKSREAIDKCVDSNEERSSPARWAFRIHVCLMNSKIREK